MYMQDYGILRREATVDMDASDEAAASIFAIGAQKHSQHFQMLVPSSHKCNIPRSEPIKMGLQVT